MTDFDPAEFSPPAWARDAVFYQIFPERFANGDKSNDPQGVEDWNAAPKGNNFFGGDLQGIIDHLGYIEDLGANAIYLNPVFASSSNHKYFTSDYLKIDPAFGTTELFKTLVDACHARQIRIVIDGVFNHTGVDHWAFQDIVKNGPDSRYAGWYNIYSYPVSLPPNKPNYECWWNYGRLPKLMAENPEVKEYLLKVTEYWTSMGIDGWRLDVPNEVPHEFWKEWRTLVKSINSDCYIVGEIWDNAEAWLRGDEFDAVMNYQFRDACLKFFCQESISVAEFDRQLSQLRSLYPPSANFVLQNLIGSHDTERYRTLCGKKTWKEKLTILFQMTYLGAPMVYYGDEIGMEGGKDPDCRRPMIWDEKKWDKDLQNFYRRLIALRNKSQALRRGSITKLVVDDKGEVYAFVRRHESENVFVLFNKNEEETTVVIPVDETIVEGTDALTGNRLARTGGALHCTVAGRAGRVIVSGISL